jgi:Zn-dependent protease/predicted transcriptional regulator
MGHNFRLARIMGIPFEINPSWFLIFFLVVWSLSVEVFPTWQAGLQPFLYWIMGIVTALALFASLLFHELCHSLVSRHFGLEVKRITLFLFGGVSETTDEMPSPRAEFLIAGAGPLSSFFLALCFAIAGRIALMVTAPSALTDALGWLAFINGALGLFNLVPGFPLDGGRIFRALVWGRTHDLKKATRFAAYGGEAFAIVLIGVGLARVFGGNWFGGFWLIFLGWLLFQAAKGSYTQLVITQSLNRITVSQIMSRQVVSLTPHLTLREVVEGHFMREAFGGYPVIENQRLLGLLTRQQVQAIASEQWDTLTVESAMIPVTELQALSPDEPVGHALATLMSGSLGRLPVLADGHVVGMLSQSDLARYLSWHATGEKGTL